MHSEGQDKRCDTLKFGEPWEKLDLLHDLEETAKDCRIAADKALRGYVTAAEREKAKPWREFRRVIGFPLFNLLLEMAQSDIRSEQRNLAADILAHLWHPAAVDRLVEDLKENAAALLGTQISGIFINLAGIGTEVSARGLISLWDEGFKHYIPEALAACNSKAGEAFLLSQARENNDPYMRGICMCYLNSVLSDEKTALLRDKLKHGETFERFGAIKKIKELRLACLAPDMRALCASTDDLLVRKELSEALRSFLSRRKQI